jgi:hypothetical protein
MQMYLNEISTAMALFCQKFANESTSSRPMPGPRMANDLAVALGETVSKIPCEYCCSYSTSAHRGLKAAWTC